MTCDAVLRRIRGDDLEALLGLYKHLYDDDLPEVAPGARAAVWGEILQDDAHYYLGAFVGERLVASAFVTVVPNVAAAAERSPCLACAAVRCCCTSARVQDAMRA